MSEDEGVIIDEPEVYVGDALITKEQMIANVNKRFFYMLQTFFRGGKQKTIGNDEAIRLYFHSVVGAYFKDYVVVKPGGLTDLRAPVIWVQNSGSGKSQLNKFAMDVGNRIGMKVVEPTEFTTPGLIGTFDRAKHDFNIKNNLSPGSNVEYTDKQGNQKSKRYAPPVVYGYMHSNDMLFIDEGKILFNPTKHTENVLSILQPALDYPGKVMKKMAAEEPIEYDCSATMCISTVKWSTLNADILLQGFFPRCLFYMRDLSVRDQAAQHLELGKKSFNEVEYAKALEDFADAIEKHPIPLSRDRKKIVVSPECLEMASDAVQRWFRLMETKLYGAESGVVMAFVSRLSVFIYKIAGQVAVLNNTVNPAITHEKVFMIKTEEMEYALSLLDPLFQQLMENLLLEESDEGKKMYSSTMILMKHMFDNNMEIMAKDEVIKIIMMKRSTGKQKAYKILNAMKSANYVTEKKTESGALVCMPNWTLWNTKDKYMKQLGDDKP